MTAIAKIRHQVHSYLGGDQREDIVGYAASGMRRACETIIKDYDPLDTGGGNTPREQPDGYEYLAQTIQDEDGTNRARVSLLYADNRNGLQTGMVFEFVPDKATGIGSFTAWHISLNDVDAWYANEPGGIARNAERPTSPITLPCDELDAEGVVRRIASDVIYDRGFNLEKTIREAELDRLQAQAMADRAAATASRAA